MLKLFLQLFLVQLGQLLEFLLELEKLPSALLCSCDAVAIDIGVANSKMNSGKFRMLEEPLMKEQYGIGFLKGNTELRYLVEKMAKYGLKGPYAVYLTAMLRHPEGLTAVRLGEICARTIPNAQARSLMASHFARGLGMWSRS